MVGGFRQYKSHGGKNNTQHTKAQTTNDAASNQHRFGFSKGK